MVIIREFETADSLKEKQRFKNEFKTYLELHLDEYMRSHPELSREDVVYLLNCEFAKKWRSGD